MRNAAALTQAAFDSSYGVTNTSAVVGVGKMSPEASDQFLDYVWDLTSIKDNCRQIRMNSDTRRVNKIGFGAKVLRPGTSGTSPGVTAQATVSEITLHAKEMVGLVKINDDELEDAIETGNDLTDHVMRLLAASMSNQLETAFLIGDNSALSGATPVDINQQVLGWVTTAQGDASAHRIDGSALGDGAGGANTPYITSSKLSKIVKTIPKKYLTRRMGWLHITSHGAYQDFVDLVAARQTVGGDVAFRATGYEQNLPNGESVLGYGGFPLYPAPLYPDAQFLVATTNALATTTNNSGVLAAGALSSILTAVTNVAIGDVIKIDTGGLAEYPTVTAVNTGTKTVTWAAADALQYAHADGVAAVRGTSTGTSILFTHFLNLIVAFKRDIRIEPTRWGPERATYFTVSLRADVGVENTDALVLCQNMQVR